MPFRSHIARPMDFRSWPNLTLIAILTLITAVAVVLWLGGNPGSVLLTPVHAMLTWALLREIDPDHDWTALIGALVTGGFALTGRDLVSAVAVLVLMAAARVVTSTTGRRLLLTDILGLGLLGAVAGFTVAGWVAGFGMAIALYADDRIRGERRLPQVFAAAATAVGTTVVATVTDAFPDVAPQLSPVIVALAGAVSVILIFREPARPVTQVDARHAAFIDKGRLHGSRSLIGLLVFAMTLLTGIHSPGLIPVLVGLGLVIVSNELALYRRRDQ